MAPLKNTPEVTEVVNFLLNEQAKWKEWKEAHLAQTVAPSRDPPAAEVEHGMDLPDSANSPKVLVVDCTCQVVGALTWSSLKTVANEFYHDWSFSFRPGQKIAYVRPPEAEPTATEDLKNWLEGRRVNLRDMETSRLWKLAHAAWALGIRLLASQTMQELMYIANHNIIPSGQFLDNVWKCTSYGSPVRHLYVLRMFTECVAEQKDLVQFLEGSVFNLGPRGWLSIVKNLLEDLRREKGDGRFIMISHELPSKHLDLKKWLAWPNTPILHMKPRSKRTSPPSSSSARVSSSVQIVQATNDDDGASASSQNAVCTREDLYFWSAMNEGIDRRAHVTVAKTPQIQLLFEDDDDEEDPPNDAIDMKCPVALLRLHSLFFQKLWMPGKPYPKTYTVHGIFRAPFEPIFRYITGLPVYDPIVVPTLENAITLAADAIEFQVVGMLRGLGKDVEFLLDQVEITVEDVALIYDACFPDDEVGLRTLRMTVREPVIRAMRNADMDVNEVAKVLKNGDALLEDDRAFY